jgi:hypothetical protein
MELGSFQKGLTLSRKAIPKHIRESVLQEFNHRCAVCGKERPQVHHIDENPSNNDQFNLLPLCPNCHLLDQHAPTTPINPTKLQLFRRFKDPTILAPQFEPLFGRLGFLMALTEASFDKEDAEAKAKELISFVAALEMGSFYGKELERLVKRPLHARVWSTDTPDYLFKKWAQEEREEYFQKLDKGREQIISLVVELLRYQKWAVTPEKVPT